MKKGDQKIIIIDGPMGAGKTTLAKLMHPKLERTALLSFNCIKWLVSDFCRNEKNNALATKVVVGMCAHYFENGLSVILEREFKRAYFMKPFLELAKNKHVPCFVYQLEVPVNILLERVRHRPKSSYSRCKPTMSKTKTNIDLYFNNKYKRARLILNSDKLRPRQLMNIVLKDIKTYRPVTT